MSGNSNMKLQPQLLGPAGEGIVRSLFPEEKPPEVTYKSRGGKYQGQRGITLPKI